MNARPFSKILTPAPVKAAFTLVELLVVIAVVATLAGLLLPSLSRAKEKGRTILCLNNLKQLQLAAVLYATDNRELLPRNYHGAYGGIPPGPLSWVGGAMSYGNDGFPAQDSTNISYLMASVCGHL